MSLDVRITFCQYVFDSEYLVAVVIF